MSEPQAPKIPDVLKKLTRDAATAANAFTGLNGEIAAAQAQIETLQALIGEVEAKQKANNLVFTELAQALNVHKQALTVKLDADHTLTLVPGSNAHVLRQQFTVASGRAAAVDVDLSEPPP